jgi:hypothetical protein
MSAAPKFTPTVWIVEVQRRLGWEFHRAFVTEEGARNQVARIDRAIAAGKKPWLFGVRVGAAKQIARAALAKVGAP